MKDQRQNLIVINGKTYDARSGMIVREASQAAAKPAPHKKVFSDIGPSVRKSAPNASVVTKHPNGMVSTGRAVQGSHFENHERSQVGAQNIHRAPQKTQTLLRSALRRPHMDIAPQKTTPIKAASQSHPQTHPDVQQASRAQRAAAIQRHAAVQRFARTPQPTPQPVTAAPKPMAVEHTLSVAQMHSQHPAAKATPRMAQAHTQPAASGSALKEQLIKEQMNAAPTEPHKNEHPDTPEDKVNSFFSKQPRLMTALAGAMGVLLLIGYVTYLNLPGISMRVAANRAGFSASMPGYKPGGYSLKGPANASPGQISLNFASNTNEDKFTLTQKQSSWDSQALLDNYVAQQTDNYLTYQEKGLTIYMYDGRASWVNGGVWYNIHGSAELSSDQILKMATSM